MHSAEWVYTMYKIVRQICCLYACIGYLVKFHCININTEVESCFNWKTKQNKAWKQNQKDCRKTYMNKISYTKYNINFLCLQKMWFSSGGTKSVLHIDYMDNIHCLITGRKLVIMIDPKNKVCNVIKFWPTLTLSFLSHSPVFKDIFNLLVTPHTVIFHDQVDLIGLSHFYFQWISQQRSQNCFINCTDWFIIRSQVNELCRDH